MSSERYRFFLTPEDGGALIRHRGSRRRHGRPSPTVDHVHKQRASLLSLLHAIEHLDRRGPGPAGWAPVAGDPVTFLLDAISDGLLVRGRDGEVVFANALAHQVGLAQRAFVAFEEFEQAGEIYTVRGLCMDLPEGSVTFTLATRNRR